MEITFHGHSVLEIQANGKTIFIDPFITGNGQCDLKAEDVKLDVILLTHGHSDHVGDTIQLAKDNDALVVAPFELANYLETKGLKVHPMHIGGSHQFEFGTVKLTQAFHGSSYTEEDGTIVYTGMPAGILFTADNKTVYAAGDTALFGDMKMYGERHTIDAAFLPIGDNFTMGPEDAAAAAEWLKAKKVIPVHYNTFPVIEQNPEEFVSLLPEGVGHILHAGDKITL